MNYVFTTELYTPVYGRPKGKNVWYFGDRNQTILVRAGSEESPVNYGKAKKIATERLQAEGFPMYKTVYLQPLDCVR